VSKPQFSVESGFWHSHAEKGEAALRFVSEFPLIVSGSAGIVAGGLMLERAVA
jgi:hypothetical protein